MFTLGNKQHNNNRFKSHNDTTAMVIQSSRRGGERDLFPPQDKTLAQPVPFAMNTRLDDHSDMTAMIIQSSRRVGDLLPPQDKTLAQPAPFAMNTRLGNVHAKQQRQQSVVLVRSDVREKQLRQQQEESQEITFTIQTTKWLYNIANSLKRILEDLGFVVRIMGENAISSEILNNQEKPHNYYILLCFWALLKNGHLPKKSKYYIYNLEQLNYHPQFPIINVVNADKELMLEATRNCIAMFDYSKTNIANYPKDLKNKALYLPIPLFKEENPKIISEKKYDVLFFGGPNDRRQKILEYLKKDMNIRVVTNVFGEELYDMIKKSRIVLNIHFKGESLLETARIHDCITRSTPLIISEESIDKAVMEEYKDIVKFVPVIKEDLSNMDELVKGIRNLSRFGDIDNTRLAAERKMQDMIKKRFDYFKIYKYPSLFHKYLLGISTPNKHITYEVIKSDDKTFNNNNLFAHLHCYDISKFNEIYSEYIENICSFFKVVITYSIGENNINDKRFVIIKIPNKGMDIGAKFCMVQYLNDNNISYEYIFFLHSKSDEKTRRKYFMPLIENLNEGFIENINDYEGYFPDIEWEIVGDRMKWISKNPAFPKHENTNWPERNLLYRNELLKYLNCDNKTNRFIEGNVYILSKKVVDKLYTDPLLYNILNTQTSFDYNWVSKRYGLLGGINNVYNDFKTKKLSPRDHLSYDGYIEHAFERVVLNLCKNTRFWYPRAQQINILVRNTYRPSYFPKCISSILNQIYQNFKVIMCYDDDDCLEYLDKYKNNPKIEIFKATEVNRTGRAFYNLYCNQLLDKVKKGWIMFLDDDDLLIDKNSLQDIANNLDNKDDMLFWKVKIADRIIYPKNSHNIEKSHISGIGFCFNSKYKNLARWDCERCSDYRFITKLLKNKKDFKRKFVNKILTGVQHTDKMGLLGKSEKFFSVDFILKNTWIWKLPNNNKDIVMTVALPALNAKKIIWLALESLKNQIDVNFAWELIVFEEKGESKKIVQSYAGLLPGCVRIIYKTITKDDAFYKIEDIKKNKCTSYYTLLEKWINMSKIADKNSKIFVKHAVDCYSPPKRLYIHYEHFKNNNCYYSTQPKGYFYNINLNKYFLYDGLKIEPYDWKNYYKHRKIYYKKIRNNKNIIYRGCHLNMALKTNIMKQVPLPNSPLRAGLDGYILYNITKIINISPEERKIIFDDQEINKDNWKYSLDTDGYNNISMTRSKIYNHYDKNKPHCIPVGSNNIDLKIPKYIMDRLKSSSSPPSPHTKGPLKMEGRAISRKYNARGSQVGDLLNPVRGYRDTVRTLSLFPASFTFNIF
jgi:hypothetical protein